MKKKNNIFYSIILYLNKYNEILIKEKRKTEKFIKYKK